MAIYTPRGRFCSPALLLIGGALLMSGCATLSGEGEPETAAVPNTPASDTAPQPDAVTLASCRTQALALDRSARSNAAPAQYFTSAKTLGDCLEEVDTGAEDEQAVMQMRALVILNYVKAGQLEKARQALQDFRAEFVAKDLYFADYSSFVDTFTLLLGERRLSPDSTLTLNVNKKLVAELRRQHYWSSH